MVSDSEILSFKQIISSVVKWKFSGTFIINMGLLLLLCSLMQLKEIGAFVNICTMAAFSEIYGDSKVDKIWEQEELKHESLMMSVLIVTGWKFYCPASHVLTLDSP